MTWSRLPHLTMEMTLMHSQPSTLLIDSIKRTPKIPRSFLNLITNISPASNWGVSKTIWNCTHNLSTVLSLTINLSQSQSTLKLSIICNKLILETFKWVDVSINPATESVISVGSSVAPNSKFRPNTEYRIYSVFENVSNTEYRIYSVFEKWSNTNTE